MKDLVMRTAEEFTDANPDLIAGDGGNQQIASRRALGLRNRQHRWEDDGRRMKDRAVVNVVLLGDVRGGAIDESREQGTRAPSGRNDLRPSIVRTHCRGELLERDDGPGAFAGERGSQPVDHEVLRAVDHRRRDVLVCQVRRELGECARPSGVDGFGHHIARVSRMLSIVGRS